MPRVRVRATWRDKALLSWLVFCFLAGVKCVFLASVVANELIWDYLQSWYLVIP